MYESLVNESQDFHLFIFPFDDKSRDILFKLNLEHVTIVPLEQFEDEQLREVKKDRTDQEYCWTCTPSIIKYSIEEYDLDNCTYLDADLYFFSNPSDLIEEMGSNSVMITEHRYTSEYDQTDTSGIYCVQFITFKNDNQGMKVLEWWRNACLDWCYARFENGKFGDQKYLDDWTKKFKGVYVLEHLGGGVAPWNVQQYKFEKSNGFIEGERKVDNITFNLIFYHFHGLKLLRNYRIDLGHYQLVKKVINLIYKPYIVSLLKWDDKIKRVTNSRVNLSLSEKKESFLEIISRKLKGIYNVFRLKNIV